MTYKTTQQNNAFYTRTIVIFEKQIGVFMLMPLAGLEPAILSEQRPKRCVYSNSTTEAPMKHNKHRNSCKRLSHSSIIYYFKFMQLERELLFARCVKK